VENRGLWALEAPPKRKKNKRKHKVLFIAWRDTRVRSNALHAFERTTCVRTHQLFVVERKKCVRSQITVVAARADWTCVRPQVPCIRTQITARAGWACVRPLLMRATPAHACDRGCVRTHPSAFERTWQESASSLGAFCLLLAMF
jgi:hypothetical protein